ncbi:DUF6966 domain-containing protein [Pseudomonas fluorescens]|uniref:DUF6966 domain-containing protein n=1 Tax=Pseudomonas fluorescens TaxID=294 RepID=UPI003974B10A
MINTAELTAIMLRISELLRLGDRLDWATLLDEYRAELPHNTTDTLSKISLLFGGMGSINDIVLYKNGQPMIKENNELDQLLSKLHDRCRNH